MVTLFYSQCHFNVFCTQKDKSCILCTFIMLLLLCICIVLILCMYFCSDLMYFTPPRTDMWLSIWFLNLSKILLFYKCRFSRGEWMDLLISSGAGETTVKALVPWVGNSGWVRFPQSFVSFFFKPKKYIYIEYFIFPRFPPKEYQFNSCGDFELHFCTLSQQEMTSFTLSPVVHQWACRLTCVQEMTRPLLIMPTSTLAQRLTTMKLSCLDTLALLVRENITLCVKKKKVFALRKTIWCTSYILSFCRWFHEISQPPSVLHQRQIPKHS